jgi:L,D-transpeptidase YcbB
MTRDLDKWFLVSVVALGVTVGPVMAQTADDSSTTINQQLLPDLTPDIVEQPLSPDLPVADPDAVVAESNDDIARRVLDAMTAGAEDPVAPEPATTDVAVPAAPEPAVPEPSTTDVAEPAAPEPVAPALTDIAEPAPPVTEPAPATPDIAVAPNAAGPVPLAIATTLGALGSDPKFADRADKAAIKAFYEARGNTPAWTGETGFSRLGQAVIARLNQADTDGLDIAALHIPDASARAATADEVAQLDIDLSFAVAVFSKDASAGRVKPASIASKDITRTPIRVDPVVALASVAAASDPAAALEEFNPPQEGFKRLKKALADIRQAPAEVPPEPIADGATLKPGMTDDRIPVLRARMGLAEVTDPINAFIFDDALVEAVKNYQAAEGLDADGIVGKATLAKINGTAEVDKEGQILVNMEMWRWMPRDLGNDHVFVNIPEFMVHVIRNGVKVHEARVVVGKTSNRTPVFSDEMEYLVVNPYWHVPESIKIKEMLPEIQADPSGYFRRHGYEAVFDGQVVNPSSILWDENAARFVGIRQVPGEANALGNIKFMFPNKHDVYLHDTPSRKLFKKDYRAYSHGCVRVDDPMSFAAAILEGDPEWTVDKLKAMFGGSERRVDLALHLKVHLAYFTAWVDDEGNLQFRDDVYGYVAKVKDALGVS